MNKLKQNFWVNIFIIYTRYLIGGAFVFSSIVKLEGNRFTAKSGANEPINSSFHFFETMYQSGIYWQFIGLGQLVAGALLMTQRFAKLGALVYFPIIVNIFMITFSYSFGNTTIITSLMLLANVSLLFWDWDELKTLINLPYKAQNPLRIERYKIWEITGLALFAFTFFFRLLVEIYNPIIWFLGCLLIGVAGLIVGFKKIK